MRQQMRRLKLLVRAGACCVLLSHCGQAFIGPIAGRFTRNTETSCRRYYSHMRRPKLSTDRRSNVRTRLSASIAPELTETVLSADAEAETGGVGSTATSEEVTVSPFNEDGSRKTGEQIRDEYFMAALTGAERGLPVGSFLNDTVEAGPDVAQVSVVWQPYEDTVVAPAGSSLLKSAVDCGAMTIDNTFCLTGQCEACMTEVDGGVVLACMVPIPADGRADMEALVCNSDAAWDDMMV